ncbi:MAG: helix-turn-helix transcriptional regulator [Deltaproteobacteria bacterium]|nr:helix-turn-helix transcriptional regulator [Deltaproteobacteria bacterium]
MARVFPRAARRNAARRNVQPALALKIAIWRSGRPQYEIALAAGLSATTLSMIVVGRRQTSASERRRIARALGVAVGRLFGARRDG